MQYIATVGKEHVAAFDILGHELILTLLECLQLGFVVALYPAGFVQAHGLPATLGVVLVLQAVLDNLELQLAHGADNLAAVELVHEELRHTLSHQSIWEIAEVLRQEMAQYPEIIEYQAALSSGGPGGGNTVDVEIYGYDFDITNQMAQQIIALTKELPGARDVYSDRDDDRPEIKIIVDKEKASRHGLTSATISSYLRNRVNGMAVGYLKEDGNEYDILVRLKEENRNSISDVLDFTIPTPTGKTIKLSEICSVDEYWAPPKIVRKSRQRIVTVKVTPYETSLGELAQAIETQVLPKVDKPAGYSIRLAGSYEDQQESFGKLGMLGALILILVYIVMASQFESFSKPAIIMFTVPFALSGVILALWMTGVSLDMIGALGIVLLVGIVVKNGIVLVDYINLMRERGVDLNEAIQISGQSRLRPVLMTAFTTILGMVPMAVSQGEGAEMWRPLGIVVIGGLTVSTFLTLYIVPIIYGAMSKKGERDKIKKVRENFIFMDIKVEDCEEK